MNVYWDSLEFVWSLDGWIIAIGILCALNTTLLGNFLILRRLSMLADAISHAILPGLALAFIIYGTRDSNSMLIGASFFGVLTAVLSEWLRGKGKVEEGAALGIVFVALFALGLILIVRAADTVDLDPSCVLFGSIELAPLSLVPFFGLEVPSAVTRLIPLLCLNSLFIFLFYKELILSAFDEGFAEAEGCRPRLLHYGLLSLVALTAVISFEVVGNILVVAMFIVPPACAHLLSNKFRHILYLSLFFAIIFPIFGHFSALYLPALIGFESTSTSGMMASVGGFIFILLLLFAPNQGVISKLIMHFRMKCSIKVDDYLADLYRAGERSSGGVASTYVLSSPLLLLARMFYFVERDIVKGYVLTQKGERRARALIRNHRLWESYLSSEVGYETGQVHSHADGFEHFTDSELQEQLHAESNFPTNDPHGKKIPGKGD